MPSVDRRPACLAAALLFAPCLLLPSPAAAVEPGARTLALVDFAVRASRGAVADSSWLGPAVSELVQAKMQLFGGARVLERLRVQSLLSAAEVDGAAAVEDPLKLAGVLPADVLIAGSVSVDPKDPRRVRAQARAFEVETSKIVSEATFTGTGDLAGLLKIAEELAHTLADGLKLAYTPEQLSYAEPAKIDTLRFFVDGEAHLAAGRHREAVASLQRALDGNEGRYYAAAHRLQGEAYQALAKASAGEEERAVREEYLKKFKADALAASGALYDLGLAYEANGMWDQAVGAFGDYLATVGTEGSRVRWRFNLKQLRTASGGEALPLQTVDYGLRVLSNGSILLLATPATSRHVGPSAGGSVPRFFLVVIDGATGRQLRDFPLDGVAGQEEGASTRVSMRLLEASNERALLGWVRESVEPGKSGECLATGVALVDVDRGAVAWTGELGLPHRRASAGYLRDTLAYAYFERDLTAERTAILATFDALTGTSLSQIEFTPAQLRQNAQSLIGLDVVRATFTDGSGRIDLKTGRQLATSPPPPGEYHPLPSGVPGIGYSVSQRGIAFYEDDRRVAFFEGWRLEPPGGREPRPIHAGPLLLGPHESSHRGLLVVDPASWEAVNILGEQGARIGVGPRGGRYVHLEVRAAGDGKPDPRFGVPEDGGQFVLVLYDTVARTLERSGAPLLGSLGVPGDGSGLVVRQEGELRLMHLLPRRGVGVLMSGEARLHRAAAFLGARDPESASREVDAFEKEFPGHGGAVLVRMRIAAARGDAASAAERALFALSWLRLDRREIDECVSALRLKFPHLRGAVPMPFRVGPLEPKSVTPRGELVIAREETQDGVDLVMVDPRRGTSRTLAVRNEKGVARGTWTYDGKYLAARMEEGKGDAPRYLVVDLESGERTISDEPPFLDPVGFLRGDRSKAMQIGPDLAVYADPVRFTPGGSVAVSVLDRGRGPEIARIDLPLENEIVVGAAADRQRGLVVGVSGGDHEAYVGGGRGTWFRVELFPFGASRARWSYESEGWIGGSPIFEADRVVVPAYEGRVPVLDRSDWKEEHPPLRLTRIALDALTGRKVQEAPLMGNPASEHIRPEPESPWRGGTSYSILVESGEERSSRIVLAQGTALWEVFYPRSSRCLFPGREFTLREQDRNCSHWWFFDPDQPPVVLLSSPSQSEYRIVRRLGPLARLRGPKPGVEQVVLVAWKDAVFEVFGGVVLVTDYAGGRGLRSITWDR